MPTQVGTPRFAHDVDFALTSYVSDAAGRLEQRAAERATLWTTIGKLERFDAADLGPTG